ncbi:hypothetical protein Bbelb_245030 [Branchiostoma belcheri]|nr:hypothetical protein Bbelb_245030 [Branchiostoma belcheri]
MGNPFYCDCDVFWLIEKMACLEACKGRDKRACCLSCSACFLAGNLKKAGRAVCYRPIQLSQLLLSEVPNHLTGCEPLLPTTEAAMVPTDLDEAENQAQSNATSPIKRFGNNSRQDPTRSESSADEPYQNDISTKSNPTQAVTNSSAHYTMSTRDKEDDELLPLYVTIIAMGILLTLTFIFGLVRGVNHGDPAVNQATPPVVNPAYHDTSDVEEDMHYDVMDENQTSALTLTSTHLGAGEGGLNQQHPTVTESVQHCMGSTHSRQSQAATEPSPLYKSSNANTAGEGLHHDPITVPHNETHCMEAMYNHPQAPLGSSSIYTSPNGNSANIYSSEDGSNRGNPVAPGDEQAATASSSLYTSPELNSANFREGMTNRGDPEVPDANEQCSEAIYGRSSQAAVTSSSHLYNRCVTD